MSRYSADRHLEAFPPHGMYILSEVLAVQYRSSAYSEVAKPTSERQIVAEFNSLIAAQPSTLPMADAVRSQLQ